MNEEIIDNQDSVEMKTTRKPIHLTIVSIGAFLLISLVLIVMMDMLITAIAQNLAIAHAGFNPNALNSPIPTYVLAVRASSIICLAASITIGFFWKKIYLYKPGRILQFLLKIFTCYLITIMLGVGIGFLLLFGFFFWDPKRFADWSKRGMSLYRTGIVGIFLTLAMGEFLNIGAVTLGVFGLIVMLYAIYTLYYWNFELSEGWYTRRKNIENLFGILLITIYSIFGIFSVAGNISAYPLPKFLLLPFSSILTPVGAGVISLGAILVVVPLYLFLPKILRDLWNLRPNIETFWREFLYHPMGILGLIIIGAIVCIALFAPYIAPYYWSNPPGTPILLDQLLQPPSPEHLLGTNHRGEDIFSRIIYGSQISLLIGFAASLVAVFLGTAVGLLSGYYGGILDTILMRITDVFLCLPTLPLMLIFLVLFGQGLQNVIIVIAILGWTGTARMVRSEALSLRERPLTEAAHALGASDGYILIHHILPNTLPLILANMILGVVSAILSEAGIAFLGFVDIHGQPSWGIILHWAWKNAALLANKWWWFIPPGVLIMLTTLGFVFVSHTADKVVNPRLRGRRK